LRWSIVICSYNRAPDLAEALERLRDLRYPEGDFEILVVDNASTDCTAQVIRDAAVKSGNLVSVIAEKPGLSFARNLGITAARGELVAFIDDDAWPEPDWLTALDRGFQQEDVMCVGGKVVAAWPEGAPPSWIPERLHCFFSIVDHGAQRFLHYPDYPAGTNIAFRKSIFNSLKGFSENLGRIGNCLLSMEEVDICLRIEEVGYKILYRDDATVHHNIQSHRLTETWLLERANWQGVSAAVIEIAKFPKRIILAKIIKYLFFIVIGVIGNILLSILQDKKNAFFCRCQTILCKAYIRQVIGLAQRREAT